MNSMTNSRVPATEADRDSLRPCKCLCGLAFATGAELVWHQRDKAERAGYSVPAIKALWEIIEEHRGADCRLSPRGIQLEAIALALGNERSDSRTALQYLYDCVDDGLPEPGAVYSQATVIDAMEGFARLAHQPSVEQIAEAIWIGETQLKTDYPPKGRFADEPDRERFLWLARYVAALASSAPAESGVDHVPDAGKMIPAGMKPWQFNADARDIEFNSAPVFKVYEADDFPCLEDDERASANEWYDAQAETAVLMLNSLLHDSGDAMPVIPTRDESDLREAEIARLRAALEAEDDYWAASRALACALPRLRPDAQHVFEAATVRRDTARAALATNGGAS